MFPQWTLTTTILRFFFYSILNQSFQVDLQVKNSFSFPDWYKQYRNNNEFMCSAFRRKFVVHKRTVDGNHNHVCLEKLFSLPNPPSNFALLEKNCYSLLRKAMSAISCFKNSTMTKEIVLPWVLPLVQFLLILLCTILKKISIFCFTWNDEFLGEQVRKKQRRRQEIWCGGGAARFPCVIFTKSSAEGARRPGPCFSGNILKSRPSETLFLAIWGQFLLEHSAKSNDISRENT